MYLSAGLPTKPIIVFQVGIKLLTCKERLCSKNGRRKITQNNIEVDTERKESTRKTEEKLDGMYKEGHERRKRKRRPMGR